MAARFVSSAMFLVVLVPLGSCPYAGSPAREHPSHERAAVERWNVVPGSREGHILDGVLVLHAEGKPRSSAVAAAINVVAVAHCIRLAVELSSKAFNAAVVVLDQARLHRIRRLSTAAVVPTMPHLVTRARRFDLSALPALHGCVRVHWCSPLPRPHRLKLHPLPAHGPLRRKLRGHCALHLVASDIARSIKVPARPDRRKLLPGRHSVRARQL